MRRTIQRLTPARGAAVLAVLAFPCLVAPGLAQSTGPGPGCGTLDPSCGQPPTPTPAATVKIERLSPPPLDLEVPLPGMSGSMLVNVGRTPLDSDQSAISADGEWVVFVTAGQVFERSRLTGTTALISAAAGSAPANGESWSPVISADGRWVVFWSHADNLAPGGTSLGGDLF